MMNIKTSAAVALIILTAFSIEVSGQAKQQVGLSALIPAPSNTES
jgi:hypothetical protein